MSVKLREKKLKNGKVSLYLDIYDRGKREYEFLNISFSPKDKNKKVYLEIAETKRSNKEVELLSSQHGIKTRSMKQIDFFQYFESKSTYHVHTTALKHWKDFIKEKYDRDNLPIQNISKNLIEEFLEYLRSIIGPNTVHTYFSATRAMLNHALKEDIIIKNPTKYVKSKHIEVKKVFLTEDELNKLAETDCPKKDHVKKAFLFACNTGLRYSDIIALKWENIKNGTMQISQRKTKEFMYIPLNQNAKKIMELIRSEENDSEFVFQLFKTLYQNNDTLRCWAKKAKIEKHISFHTSRHTYATWMLSKGTDIYTVSKLLGHKNLRTTEVYAKIIDETKVNAVNKLTELNLV